MVEINTLDPTDASNTARFPEGMRTNSVNNAARSLEGILARWYQDNNGTISVTGTTTCTAAINVDTGFALYDGYTIVCDFTSANTGAVTLNLTPDGGSALGAKAVKKGVSNELVADDILAGQKVTLMYDGTNFQLTSGIGTDASTSAAAAAVSAAAAAADAILTAADVVSTNADVVTTNADVVLTNADVVTAGVSETNAAASAATAAALALGWADVVTVTTGTTNIEEADAKNYYILDASSGTITMNLPAVGTTDGMTFAFEVLDASNAITIARDGTDTINQTAADYTSLTGVGDVVHFISIDGTPDDWSARLISRFVVDDTTIEQSGRTISIKDDGVTPAKAVAGRNAQTGTTYTLALTDNLKTITMSNASANTLTIPTNASVAFTADEVRIDVFMLGAGVTTITGDTGVTVNGVSAGSGVLAQYGACSLLKIDTDTWIAIGLTVA